MIEGIIHNSEAAAIALDTRVHARMQAKKKELRYKATSFFSIIKHPTLDKWLTIVDRNRVTPISKELIAELSPGDINQVEAIGDDWFPTTDLP
jgi:hypothetical protein